jgi:hypothetical protein
VVPQDLLHAASDTSEDVKRSLALVSRSAREAWERRQVARAAAAAAAAAARSYDGAAAAAPPRPTPATLLADFLAALNEGGAAAERPGRGTQLLNSRLGERLLERAAAGEAEPGEQEATVRYIAAVLRSEEAAEALLQRPGAAPMLLALARRAPPLRPLLAEAASRGEAARLVPHADAAAVVALVTEELRGLRGGSAPPTAAPRHQLLLAGLQLLLGWARASPGNASRLAEAGAGPLLAELAAGVATGSGAEALQGAAAALMGVLARQAGGTEALRMQGWLYPLLCLAADAAAGGHWQLAHAALDAFAACLLRGCELPVGGRGWAAGTAWGLHQRPAPAACSWLSRTRFCATAVTRAVCERERARAPPPPGGPAGAAHAAERAAAAAPPGGGARLPGAARHCARCARPG